MEEAAMSESRTPLTDAAIIEFEYSFHGLGGEMLGGSKDMIEPDFARTLEILLADAMEALASTIEGRVIWPINVQAAENLAARYRALTGKERP